MSNVQWSLGGPGPDIGQQFQAGQDRGRILRQQQERTDALRGYVANPNDPNAQNALTVADPALSAQLGDQRMQQQRFQHQQHIDALAQHQDRINLAGEIMAQHPVTDQAGYTQVIAALHQRGYDVSDIPATFDPNYVAQINQLYAAFQRQGPGYTVGQGDTRFRGDGTVEARGAPPPTRYYPVARGGTLVPEPTAPVNLPHASTQADIAHLPPGSQFIAPDGLVHTVPGGGAGQPQAQGTFPRQDGGAFDFSLHPAGR